ncbi:MAG: single-stranded-DNA-specific exonuclease RecJ [Thermovenabulum sp.]|uniref:single-stranded-DNA-specific exonuclease RecJ n=1 Tax=Thermovenabulum sp. TaxID=3100335 RepID=UPI003C7C297F
MIDGNYLWDIGPEDLEIDENIELHPVMLKILSKRGIKEKENIKKFIEPKYSDLYNPLLLKDMDKAIERINKAILNREKITIFGDYDVDGITGTAILYRGLLEKGAFIDYYIPTRQEEGYGLNINAVEKLAQKGTQLIITVDNGIACFAEIKRALDLGLDVVVFDHHEPHDELPPAIAVVDPKRPDSDYPFKELSGVGVAFKFLQAYLGHQQALKYLDLTAVGTIADLVPLHDENRVIVKLGLEALKKTENKGLRSLFSISGCSLAKIDAEKISFLIAPRLNAAGRMADAALAVELLTTEDEERAKILAKELDNHNRLRQSIENKIYKEVEENIQRDESSKENSVIVVAGQNWHEGVIGIVASKITQNYYKPAIIISKEENYSRGSARSIPGFNIFEALNKISYLFEKFGGHEQAAGFTIKNENIDLLKAKINEIAEEMKIKEHIPTLSIDLELKGSEIDLNLAKELSLLEPFGFGNPKPVFTCKNLSVKSIKSIGNGEKHLKIEFVKKNKKFIAIGFNYGDYREKLLMAPLLDVAFYLEVNEWEGKEELQLNIKDVKIPYLKDSLLKRVEVEYYKEFFSLNFKKLYTKISNKEIFCEKLQLLMPKNKRKFINELSKSQKVFVHFHTPYQAWRFLDYYIKKEKKIEELVVCFNIKNHIENFNKKDRSIIININPFFDGEVVTQNLLNNVDSIVFYDPPFTMEQFSSEIIIADKIPVYIVFNKEDLRYNYMVLENILIKEKNVLINFINYCRESFKKADSDIYEEPLSSILRNLNNRLGSKIELPLVFCMLHILRKSKLIDFAIKKDVLLIRNIDLKEKIVDLEGLEILKDLLKLKKGLIGFYNNFNIIKNFK